MLPARVHGPNSARFIWAHSRKKTASGLSGRSKYYPRSTCSMRHVLGQRMPPPVHRPRRTRASGPARFSPPPGSSKPPNICCNLSLFHTSHVSPKGRQWWRPSSPDTANGMLQKGAAMIHFNQELLGDLGSSLSREWLETNGQGGFASSTVLGLNTRRYHGLLVAATKPPVGRYLLLSKLEETLLFDGRAFDLSTNHYPAVVHPQGFRYLKEFRLDPFPVFTYEIEGIEFEKTVFMVHGENSTIIQYQLGNVGGSKSLPEKIALELRPLIAFRDYHSTTHENAALNAAVASLPGLASITPYTGLPSLHLAHNAGQLESGNASLYRNFEYEAEHGRGLHFAEDLFTPCLLRFDLRPGAGAMIIASTQPRDAASVDEYRQAEICRRVSIVRHAPLKDAFVESLTTAADQFIVARGKQKTVIAGYHWFSDWGRDTMIALPGLALTTGRYDVARSILRTFARHVDQGMLPNRFPDAGETPEYNTVDATLWFFEAARSFLAYTGDAEFVRTELYPVFADIIAWHARGTRYGIKVDPSGLLTSGEPSVQLTWMDAKRGGWGGTPPRGRPLGDSGPV